MKKVNEKLVEVCVYFLLDFVVLGLYEEKILEEVIKIGVLKMVSVVDELEDNFDDLGNQLELLVEMVSNFKIVDVM